MEKVDYLLEEYYKRDEEYLKRKIELKGESNMSEYTGNEWRIDVRKWVDGTLFADILAAVDDDIEDVRKIGILTTSEVTKKKEMKANAQLIAAAPELLELIQEIYSYYYVQGNHFLEDEMREKLKNVIKKAKGDDE